MTRPIIGWNHPVDSFPTAPEETWRLYAILAPGIICIQTNAAPEDYERLREQYQPKVWLLKHKTGPRQLGHLVPEAETDPMGYDEDGWWRSLEACLHWFEEHGLLGQLIIQADNEPDNELPRKGQSDNLEAREEAAASYERYFIKLHAGLTRWLERGVRLTVAPLSQGTPERFEWWRNRLAGCYALASATVDHCYRTSAWLQDPDWAGRYASWDGAVVIGETDLDGDIEGMGQYDQGKLLGEYVRSLEGTNVTAVCLFTAPGAADEDDRRAMGQGWWFLTPTFVQGFLVGLNATPMVDPPPPPEPPPPESEPSMTESDILTWSQLIRWQAVEAILFNAGGAFARYWLAHPEIGAPLEDEKEAHDADGNVTLSVQPFANATLTWRPGDADAAVWDGHTGL